MFVMSKKNMYKKNIKWVPFVPTYQKGELGKSATLHHKGANQSIKNERAESITEKRQANTRAIIHNKDS